MTDLTDLIKRLRFEGECDGPTIVETMREAADALENTQATLTDLSLVRAGQDVQGGPFVLQMKAEIMPLIAEAMVGWFKDCKGENYVEVTLALPDSSIGPFSLLMQRKHGKTPAEVNCELRAEIARLKAVQP